MANMIKDLLSPDQAKLLDDQLRKQSLQQGVTNYGSDPMGRFLTAASGAQRASAGFGMLGERLMGGRQMGANEMQAIQAQKQAIDKETAERKKMESLQSKLKGADENQLMTIYQNNAVANPTLAEAAKKTLELKNEAKKNKLGSETGKPSAKIMTNKDDGLSYRVVNDGKGNVKVFKAGTSQEVDPNSINLVESTVFNTLQRGVEENKKRTLEEQDAHIESVLGSMTETGQRMYNEKIAKLPMDIAPSDRNAQKIVIALDVLGEDRVLQAELATNDFTTTMDFMKARADNIQTKRAGMSAAGYKVGQFLPGTDAYDIASDVSTLQSEAFMTQLMAMKEAAANGASGMGQVTEKEVQLLIDSLGNIDPAQSKEQFNKNLKGFLEKYETIQTKIARGKGGNVPEYLDKDSGSSSTFNDFDQAVQAAQALYPNRSVEEIKAMLRKQAGG